MKLDFGVLFASIGLVIANAFFVAAEYSLVSLRRSKVERMAQSGHKSAMVLLRVVQNLSRYIAGLQIAITMCSIGVGSIVEPSVTGALNHAMHAAIPPGARVAISILLVTFFLVVLGELVPKYLTLRYCERVALLTVRPVVWVVIVLTPLVWLVQKAGGLVLLLFGVDITKSRSDALPKEELVMLVETGSAEGVLEKMSAELVTRALKIDALDAQDIMVHRLDIKWLDADLPKATVLERLKTIPFTRIPVCNGDIDELVGLAYLHDIVKNLDDPEFSLRKIVREPVLVPESLSLERIIAQMRDNKTQIVVVIDEYGGTSGLLTLEDVVEEVFGELEDRIEGDRPPIERLEGDRVSARAEIRFDELIDKLDIDIENPATDTLAQIIVDALDRVPRAGDSVETAIGTLRVENMARRRITRVSIHLSGPAKAPPES